MGNANDMLKKDFRGEVWNNIHPELLDAILEANTVPVDGGYGEEQYARKATDLMQQYFSEKIYTTFAINGTAANVMAMKAMLDKWSTILCASQSHINTYEAGALEFNLGNKILSIECEDGKLTPAKVNKLLASVKNYKYIPKVIVITQPTEFGTVYTNDELKELCDYAHAMGLYVYIDGARIGNGVVALNTNFTDMIEKTGVDAFSFGGTKVGAMMGEMIVFRRKEFANYLKYSQKQSLQHMSKSKFLSVQIARILETDLWLKNARIGNEKAKQLETALAQKGIKTAYQVQSNMVFAIIDPKTFEKIQKVHDLHYWNENNVVRLATTHLTTDEQIKDFIELL